MDNPERKQPKIVIPAEPLDLREVYEFASSKTLGSNTYTKVHLVRSRKHNNETRVLKEVPLSTCPNKAVATEAIQNEIAALIAMQEACFHKKIDCAVVPITGWFSSGNSNILFIEYAHIKGGNLLEFIQSLNKDSFNKKISRILKQFYRLVSTIQELHRQCILHRKIAPVNILWDSQKDSLYLADFGNACTIPDCFQSNTRTRTSDSSLYQDPVPELQSLLQDETSDLFSIGSVFYTILTNDTFLTPLATSEKALERLYEKAVKILKQLLADSENELPAATTDSLRICINGIISWINPLNTTSRYSIGSVLLAFESSNTSLLSPITQLSCQNYLGAKTTLPQNTNQLVFLHTLTNHAKQLAKKIDQNLDYEDFLFELRKAAKKQNNFYLHAFVKTHAQFVYYVAYKQSD